MCLLQLFKALEQRGVQLKSDKDEIDTLMETAILALRTCMVELERVFTLSDCFKSKYMHVLRRTVCHEALVGNNGESDDELTENPLIPVLGISEAAIQAQHDAMKAALAALQSGAFPFPQQLVQQPPPTVIQPMLNSTMLSNSLQAALLERPWELLRQFMLPPTTPATFEGDDTAPKPPSEKSPEKTDMTTVGLSSKLALFILLLFACQPGTSLFDADISSATEGELEQMQKYLSKKLTLIENAIKNSRRKRSVSPISASLPNRESAGFLSRIGAIKKTLEEVKPVSNNITLTPTSENLDGPTPQADISSPQPKFESGKFQHINDSLLTECKTLSQPELVAELKQKGTYNPELMAWDALGVIRFLDRTIHEHYQKSSAKNKSKTEVIERNVEALEKLMRELNVTCDLRSDEIRHKFHNISFVDPRRTVFSPSLRRSKRMDGIEEFLKVLNVTQPVDEPVSRLYDQPLSVENERITYRQKLIGESHIVPFGCDKRGAEEDGYLRLCGACQAIRRLPDTFFPPFINEVTCDTDKACLYFYDYPHGKCRQKHMNFVVLRNVGTKECQVWKKFNLNVRVSCECFVDEMSFFAKYV
ncbi:unnamed protein product [Caenorhabditis sp. 36 PRJEB53466]|nr:unnamed protein product [Caenorhabditis sp. 36 PRJEB53466]